MKSNIIIPFDVSIDKLNSLLIIKGKLGTNILDLKTLDKYGLCLVNNKASELTIITSFKDELANLTLTKISNKIQEAIYGVRNGYSIYLNIVGVGSRVELTENGLIRFRLGKSHDIIFDVEDDIRLIILKPTNLCIYGLDKERVSHTASRIKLLSPVEVYKGKGISYLDEVIKLKEGKKK